MVQYHVIRTKHNGREKSDFELCRPNGTGDFLLLYFKSPVIFTLFDEVRRVVPGECILLSPGTPHGFCPDRCELVHDWMHFMPSDPDGFAGMNMEVNSFFTADDLSFITTAIKRCETELIYKDALYEELISAEVSRMLIRLKRQLSGVGAGDHADTLKTLRMDIYGEPEKYKNVEQMAELAGLSRTRFSVVYKERFGVSPKQDLIDARIAKASYLLSSETPSLTKISEACGYQSIYHFIRQFRDVTGTTPGKYRKNQ